jgi:hypothetical protein
MNESHRRPARYDKEGHQAMIRKEIAQRAAMFYRLKFDLASATARVLDNVDWDFEPTRGRPAWLNDKEVQSIVEATYKRRPV